MANHQPKRSEKFDPIEDGDDSDTIRMGSSKFWDAMGSPAVSHDFKISDSTLSSTYINYPACLEFNITRLVKDRESTCKSSPHGSGNGPETIASALLTYEEFESLRDSDKLQYFDKMTVALARWVNFEKSCPRIDEFVLRHYDNNNRLLSDEVSLSVEENIKQKWGLPNGPSIDLVLRRPCRIGSNLVRWSDNDLRWNSADMRFDLKSYCVSHLHAPLEQDDFERWLHQYGFFYHITSSQLLYRLNILASKLGDATGDDDKCPWNMTDEYKCSWDISIQHTDNVSTLRFWDSKGRARAQFSGLGETQVDALELINFVTGFGFFHTYDNLIAGTVA